MTSARDQILAKLRQGRRDTRAAPPPYVAPAAEPDLLTCFTRGLDKVFATHEMVSKADEVAKAVDRYLQVNEGGNQLVITDAITDTGLLNGSGLELLPAPTRGNEPNAIAMAFAGIAETGSLVMLSGPASPVTTNFLPDNFICVLCVKDIVNDMESLWRRMADEGREMPRTVNLITGPSRTADVEQIIQMGAHGPRRVHVILID